MSPAAFPTGDSRPRRDRCVRAAIGDSRLYRGKPCWHACWFPTAGGPAVPALGELGLPLLPQQLQVPLRRLRRHGPAPSARRALPLPGRGSGSPRWRRWRRRGPGGGRQVTGDGTGRSELRSGRGRKGGRRRGRVSTAGSLNGAGRPLRGLPVGLGREPRPLSGPSEPPPPPHAGRVLQPPAGSWLWFIHAT